MPVLKARMPDDSWAVLGGVGVGVPPGGALGQVLTKTSTADYDTQWGTNQPIFANNSYLQGYRADGTTIQSLIGVTTGDDIRIGSGLAAGKIIRLEGAAAVLSNNNALDTYRSDGTTRQHLISCGSDNIMHVAYGPAADIYFSQNAQGNIQIGNALAAGKNIYVPRLSLQGSPGDAVLFLENDRWIEMKNTSGTPRRVMGRWTNNTLYVGDDSDPIHVRGNPVTMSRLTVHSTVTLQDQNDVLSSTGLRIIYPWQGDSSVQFALNCNARFNLNAGNTYFSRDIAVEGSVQTTGGVYKGGSAYNHPDFVFEHAYTGRVEKFALAHGAKDYEGLIPLDEVERHTRETLRLPGARGDRYDLFARGDELLAEVERLYLHLFEHERRLKALEAR